MSAILLQPRFQLSRWQGIARPGAAQARRCLRVLAKQGGMGDETMDVAVFRFTLGIPGFEDRLVPRVVAGIGAALLGLNHLITGVTTEAQGRAELLCGALVLVLALVPDIEERLREAQTGRGRQSSAAEVAGSTNAFLLDAQLADKPKQELAWASFALLKNTNSCGALVLDSKKALLARGALGSSCVTPGQTAQSLSQISKDIASMSATSKDLMSVWSGEAQQLWLPDRSAINQSGLAACASIPKGAESLLAQHVPAGVSGQPGGLLLLFSERPRALSDRERSWAAAFAKKLTSTL